MLESVGKLVCVDCDHLTEVIFTCAVLKGNQLTLKSFARCSVCYARGDFRSLRGTVEIDREDIYEAIRRGLFVLAIP